MKKHNKKLLFSILFSTILLGIAQANVKQEIQKPLEIITPNEILDNIIDRTFAENPLQEITEDSFAPTSFYIQGDFETKWKKANFWNANDNGGVAIGPFQIHSNHLLTPFMNYLKKTAPNYYTLLENKGGISAILKNKPEMKEYFCTLCATDKNFINLQCEFMDKNNFQPRINEIQKEYGLDLSNRPEVIKGLFRTMLGNINKKTDTIVNDMIITIAKSHYNITTEPTDEMIEAIIQNGYINTISDTLFLDIIQNSIHTIINNQIQKKFSDQLISAYDFIIEKDVRPNLNKLQKSKENEKILKQQNKQDMANNIINMLNKEFGIEFSDATKEKFEKQIISEKDTTFSKTKQDIKDYVKTPKYSDELEIITLGKKVLGKQEKKQYLQINPEQTDIPVETDNRFLWKFPRKKQAINTKPTKAKKTPNIILVEDIINRNNKKAQQKPSLLHRAEMIRMSNILKKSQKYL